MYQLKNLYSVLKITLPFIGIHLFFLASLIIIFYLTVGIPLYYNYDSWLKEIEIYTFYLLYALVIFPINIAILRDKMKNAHQNKSIYRIHIYTAYFLLAPALFIVISSLLIGAYFSSR